MDTVREVLHLGRKDAPQEPTPQQLSELKEKYTAAGQGQVLTFYDSLSSAEKASLYQQLDLFDPTYINTIAAKALSPPKSEDGDAAGQPSLEPLPESASASILDSKPEDIDRWYSEGLGLIAANKVGVVLMAGGQGTRLGSSAPKGCFDIGLPSAKSLFQIQAERIRKVEQLAAKKTGTSNVTVPWYVMTSGPTRGPTEQYFREHNYFGLKPENVVIFEQGVLPCISNDGKILLESQGKVAVAPDGNGGIYNALVESKVLDDMKTRGIEHIHAYCVDNCLVKVADPVFIGFSAAANVDIATKVVRKRNATESVGLIVCKNGRPDVVEYSEIDPAVAAEEDPKHKGLLRFRAANIVNHYYSVRFLESIPEWAKSLPHHVARKKIPHADLETGETVKPAKPNGIKLEQFVFDVFPMLEMSKFACMEVRREDEFSPLKNARGTGEDDPDTSKYDIMAQGKRWVQAAGATVVSGDPKSGIEVSPLMSYGGEGLEKVAGQTITAPAAIEIE
ncbi:nucleotide-diphospho-sugar transferase [Trichocladium antarcticum]|uniref:UDP-N-acetylglucosamine diphosphorylase n=1 Tax=Trichocladium antarcticum TaxID=1450529 RepID=A0AAN6ZEX5_9PEZI|nr:nucleotide-diphospho-sugar transferase [Trichocladium antarcticum]